MWLRIVREWTSCDGRRGAVLSPVVRIMTLWDRTGLVSERLLHQVWQTLLSYRYWFTALNVLLCI